MWGDEATLKRSPALTLQSVEYGRQAEKGSAAILWSKMCRISRWQEAARVKEMDRIEVQCSPKKRK